MMFLTVLMIMLTSANTVDGLRRLLGEGVPSINNPANGKFEQQIHQVVNSILKELEGSFVTFSKDEKESKQDYLEERDNTISEAKKNTIQYEESAKKSNAELILKQKEVDALTKKVNEAKQALKLAEAKEQASIKNAHSLFNRSVETLTKNGVNVRKTTCVEYRQMKEFRTLVDDLDEKYKFNKLFTPKQVENVCASKTCQYSEGYHLGKPFTCDQMSQLKPNYADIIINNKQSSQQQCCKQHRKCADEGKVCQCKGYVAYGSMKRFTKWKKVNGQIKCNNQTFGDVNPGYPKDCFCKA